MQHVVEQVLQAESEAKARIDAAKQRAAETRAAADSSVAELVASVRERSTAASAERLERARGQARELLARARAEDEAAGAALLESAAARTDGIVSRIVALIRGQPG